MHVFQSLVCRVEMPSPDEDVKTDTNVNVVEDKKETPAPEVDAEVITKEEPVDEPTAMEVEEPVATEKTEEKEVPEVIITNEKPAAPDEAPVPLGNETIDRILLCNFYGIQVCLQVMNLLIVDNMSDR